MIAAEAKMTGLENKGRRVRRCVLCVAVNLAFGFAAGYVERVSAQQREAPRERDSSRRMADGKQWMARNLNVRIAGSYCYGDAERNCDQYGRLYTWESARRACQQLGGGWRLPTDEEWRRMARHYGGVREDAIDGGKQAYKALLTGGTSGFDVVLGGYRSEHGAFARLDAHGFYWTASENDAATSWFYNFGKGSRILNRHRDGNKQMAISVRCVRD